MEGISTQIYLISWLSVSTVIQACDPVIKQSEETFLKEVVPGTRPVVFKKDLVPSDKLIHRGIFNPDLNEYYFTLSDSNFRNFDIFFISELDGDWSKPEKAFFNSKYDDHGMSFSPNGEEIYFSSTRPVNQSDIADTWHIWRCKNINGKWTSPSYVDIPNLRHKLVSHPSITKSGTLYFHSSNLDYSGMDIYYSHQTGNKFSPAGKLQLPMDSSVLRCTPFVSDSGDYLVYAIISTHLDFMITYKNQDGIWQQGVPFSDKINANGQGNPYITPDNRFLFFTAGEIGEEWFVKWVNIESTLNSVLSKN